MTYWPRGARMLGIPDKAIIRNCLNMFCVRKMQEDLKATSLCDVLDYIPFAPLVSDHMEKMEQKQQQLSQSLYTLKI